jgi:hypothetical protein
MLFVLVYVSPAPDYWHTSPSGICGPPEDAGHAIDGERAREDELKRPVALLFDCVVEEVVGRRVQWLARLKHVPCPHACAVEFDVVFHESSIATRAAAKMMTSSARNERVIITTVSRSIINGATYFDLALGLYPVAQRRRTPPT